MKIAHLLPYTAQFPLKKHNGRYEWVLRLARHQRFFGHDVTLYAAPGSSDNSGICFASLDIVAGDRRANNIALMKQGLADDSFDIFHSHFDALHYELAHVTDRPIVVTQHWHPNVSIAATYHAFTPSNVHTVPITQYMKLVDERLGIPHTEIIGHGIDLEMFRPETGAVSERFLFVGRIAAHKGADVAVRFAKIAGIKLDLIGKINDRDKSYWHTIEPSVDGDQIRYLGPKSQADVSMAMSRARALLFPVQAIEAFGQVTVEAQACGTPVIISAIGASAELVIDGKTGFIAHDNDDYLKAIERIGEIDRRECRKFAEQFDFQRMCARYEALYKRLLLNR